MYIYIPLYHINQSETAFCHGCFVTKALIATYDDWSCPSVNTLKAGTNNAAVLLKTV